MITTFDVKYPPRLTNIPSLLTSHQQQVDISYHGQIFRYKLIEIEIMNIEHLSNLSYIFIKLFLYEMYVHVWFLIH